MGRLPIGVGSTVFFSAFAGLVDINVFKGTCTVHEVLAADESIEVGYHVREQDLDRQVYSVIVLYYHCALIVLCCLCLCQGTGMFDDGATVPPPMHPYNQNQA